MSPWDESSPEVPFFCVDSDGILYVLKTEETVSEVLMNVFYKMYQDSILTHAHKKPVHA